MNRKKSLKLARMKRHDRVNGILYPEDKFKTSWDVWISIVLLVTCIILPARIAFIKPKEDEHTINTWLVINTILDFFFLLDMVVIFNSAFYDEYLKIIDDRKPIAKKYLTGWFTIDVLSIIPFDVIFSKLYLTGLVRFVKIGRLYKLIKITRLLKLLKIVREQKRFFGILNEYMQLGVGCERLIFFSIMSTIAIHIVTCLWIIFP
jgi:hypothetical protein